MDNNYLIEIFKLTNDEVYVKAARQIIEFITEIYRNIEPSHFSGTIVVFHNISEKIGLDDESKEKFYDKAILNNSYISLIFEIDGSDESPSIWTNIDSNKIDDLLSMEDQFIAYVYSNKKEKFIVNKQEVLIKNGYSCPSIFSLHYHELNEALQDYKNERIRNVSCEHFKNAWDNNKWIYFKNKPEEIMQLSLSEFLKSRIRGINTTREYPLGASKPVDIRVYWREANRAALIEVKWLGQSLKEDKTLGTSYSNSRAKDGVKQIKEYIDLEKRDTPVIITKGFLIVIDGRRRNINSSIVNSISHEDGFYYSCQELTIEESLHYWKTHPNIEKPIRMFVEPICEI